MRLWFYLSLLAVFAAPTAATEMVYSFQNPSFSGGNPLNGATLLNQANAQNGFTNPTATLNAAGAQKSQLQLFTNSLESAILNKVALGSASTLFDPTSGNIKPGTSVNVGSFSVAVSAPFGNVGSQLVTITINDGISQTTLTVPYVP